MDVMESKRLGERIGELERELEEIDQASKQEGREAYTDQEFARFDEIRREMEETQVKRATAERREFLNRKDSRLDKTELSRPVQFSRGKTITRGDYELALRGLLVRGTEAYEDCHHEALNKLGWLQRGSTFKLSLMDDQPATFEEIKRGQTVGTTTEGGFTKNDAMVAGLEVALKAFGGVLNVSNVIRTGDGADLRFATVNDTSNVAAIIAENTATTTTDFVFAAKTFKAYKFSSGCHPISRELIQDNVVNLSGYVGGAMGERHGRAINQYGTTGTGSSQPQGCVVASTLGKTAAANNAITASELTDLYHAVDPAYRNSPNCVWMMNDATAGVLEKLSDSTGRPLWGNGLNASPEDLLKGKRVVINNNMASIGSATKPILFGDFSKFLVRMVRDIEIRVANERYVELDAIGVFSFARWDSGLVDAGTNPVKHLIMAV